MAQNERTNVNKFREQRLRSSVESVMGFLEVCINQVLYCRKVYPEVLFKLTSCYVNLPIYQVQDPSVKDFIRDGLEDLKVLMLQEKPQIHIKKFQILLMDGNERTLETFSFGLPSRQEFEECQTPLYRSAVMQLMARMTDLPELSDDEDLTFTFRVSTGESGAGSGGESEFRPLTWYQVQEEDLDDQYSPLFSSNLSTSNKTVIPVTDQKLLSIEIEVAGT